MLINNKPIISMDISSDGEIIATVSFNLTFLLEL